MAENNRVLNHSEFAAKYNQQSEQDIAASYSEIQSASDNFQEGFDDSTYEEGQAGPKRPLAQGAEETPAAPDGMPAEPTEGMAAPNDAEEEADDHITPEEMEGEDEDFEGGEEAESEDTEDFEDDGSGDPEAGESDDDEDEDEDEEEEEEETNESVRVVRNSLILESFDEFEARGPIHMPKGDNMYADDVETIELDFEGDEEEQDEDGDCFVTCRSCGSKKGIEKGSYPMGMDNQQDPNSWWQGAEMGMQCGCK